MKRRIEFSPAPHVLRPQLPGIFLQKARQFREVIFGEPGADVFRSTGSSNSKLLETFADTAITIERRVKRPALGLLGPGATPIGAGLNALMLLKEPAEIAGIPRAEAVADLLDRQIQLLQAGAGFVNQSLMDLR